MHACVCKRVRVCVCKRVRVCVCKRVRVCKCEPSCNMFIIHSHRPGGRGVLFHPQHTEGAAGNFLETFLTKDNMINMQKPYIINMQKPYIIIIDRSIEQARPTSIF